MKKLLFLFTVTTLSFFASAQTCPDPVVTSFNVVKINGLPQVTITWSGPIDTFYVEYGPTGFVMGTGQTANGTSGQINGIAYNIIDTVISVSPPQYYGGCYSLTFYMYRVCSSGTSDTIIFSHDIENSIDFPIPRGNSYRFENFNQGCMVDTPTTSSGKGFQIGNIAYNPPNFGASNLLSPYEKYDGNAPYQKYIYARGAGLIDTAMRITSPYFEFTQATDFAYGFFFSNNTTNPGDNVTFTVDLETDLGYYPNVFSYSGDHPNWQMFQIPLAAYYSIGVKAVRIIINIDQSTSLQPIYNDLLFDSMNIFKLLPSTSTSPSITITQPNVGAAQIVRVTKSLKQSTYQWGPTGFLPNNGQQLGDTVVYLEDSVFLTGLPPQAQWVYFKDTVVPTLYYEPQWYGPYNLAGAAGNPAVYGKIFIDRDTNCIFGPKDIPLIGYQRFALLNSIGSLGSLNYGIYSHSPAGYYQTLLPNRNYRIFYHDTTNLNYTHYGNCTPGVYYFNTYGQKSFEANFIENPSPLPNVKVYLDWPGSSLQGEIKEVFFKIQNTDASVHDSVRAQLKIYNQNCLDSVFWNNSTLIAVSPHLIYEKWYYNLDGTTLDTFIIRSTVDTACFGTTVTFKLRVDSLPQEQYLNDNSVVTYIQLVSAIDPNDKQVIPAENTTLTTVDTLDYQIRFQNTGNYAAQNVRVVDTLPSFFANAEFVLNGASHEMYVSKDSNNVVTFFFYNIQLPDSTTDLEGSQGFISYRIILPQPMVLHDSVANRAHIFFDYQPAVITNYAWTKIVAPSNVGIDELQIGFNAYPNPAQDKINISLNQSGNYNLQLLDLAGKVLMKQNFDGHQTTLDVAHLVNGSYILHLSGNGQKARGVQKINILR